MILLASASPRRAEILKRHGIEFIVDPANIDESAFPREEPEAYVLRIARAKASDRALISSKAKLADCALVLAADTSVIVDGRILGKPLGFEDFSAMMGLLSCNTHTVLSAVAVISLDKALNQEQNQELNQEINRHTGTHIQSFVVKTNVGFRKLTEQEIAAYWQTGEPKDKAGGYAIQGLAAEFIQTIEGSYSNVVGLPVCETMQLLKDHKITSYLSGAGTRPRSG